MQEIDANGYVLTGLHLAEVLHLTYDDLIAPLYTAPEVIDPERAALTAELLRQQGELFRMEGDPERAEASQRHALRLYLRVYLSGSAHQSPDTARRIRFLLFDLDWRTLDPTAWPLLFRFYDHTGAYGEAENVLFAYAETPLADESLLREGLAFFRRLRAKDPALLAEGGLPYEEIGEGVRAFRALFGR